MKKILWSKSIWFFDVDDTLINTAALTELASEGIRQVMVENFGNDVGNKIQREFIYLFDLALAGYRVTSEEGWKNIPGGKEAFGELHYRIDALQQQTIERYGKAKKWSREVFIRIASENCGVDPSAEVILEAADAYWMTLAMRCEVLPEALQLLREIEKHHRPIYLITGSDARLQLNEKKEFIYNPEISEALKRERIEILRSKGVNFRSVSIGNPLDKPHKKFYLKGVRAAQQDLGDEFSFGAAIMVGDSYEGDLRVPKDELGFGLVALFQPGAGDALISDARQVTVSQLSDIAQFLDN